jgi:hypothetical protein
MSKSLEVDTFIIGRLLGELELFIAFHVTLADMDLLNSHRTKSMLFPTG